MRQPVGGRAVLPPVCCSDRQHRKSVLSSGVARLGVVMDCFSTESPGGAGVARTAELRSSLLRWEWVAAGAAVGTAAAVVGCLLFFRLDSPPDAPERPGQPPRVAAAEPPETAPQPGPWSRLTSDLTRPAPKPVSDAPSYFAYRQLAMEGPEALDRRLAADAAAWLRDRPEPAPLFRLRNPSSSTPQADRLPRPAQAIHAPKLRRYS